MGEGRKEPAIIGKTKPAVRRPWRPAVPVILAMLTCAALLTGTLTGRMPGLGFWLKSATMLATAGIIAFIQFRSWILALGAALGPLPASALVLCVALRAPGPFPFSIPVALVYVFGFLIALMLTARFVSRVSGGAASGPFSRCHRDRISAAAVAIFMPTLPAIAGSHRLLLEALLLASGNAASALIAPIVVSAACSFPVSDEDFIARTNRIRESWARRLEPLISVSRSPWNWSASGIFAVFLMVALFGAARFRAAGSAEYLQAAAVYAAGFLLIASFVVTLEWRRALAVWAVSVAVVPVAVWGYAQNDANLDGLLAPVTADLWGLGFLLIAGIAASAVHSGHEDLESAAANATVETGPSAAMGVIAALLMLGLWYREEGAARLGVFLAIGFSGGGALAFQPALTAAIQEVFPRRRSQAERYRVK